MRTTTFVLIMGLCVAAIAAAQDRDASKPAGTSTTVELTGCVSLSPGTSGQYAFVEGESGGTYRLTGKGIKDYAGQRVTVVADPNSKKPKFRFGLWPSPNVAAQAGAMDPAQESIARQQGGAASNADARFPELRVVRMRGAAGACR